jgi:hypothetical protein
MTISKWTSRKFWVAIGAIGTATALLGFNLIGEETWRWVFSVTVASYMAGNGIEALANGKKNGS